MNKKILGIVGAVVVIGLVIFLLTNKKGESPSGETLNNTEVKSAEEQKSLKELMAQGRPQRCEVKQTVGETSTEGKYYFAEGKMRGDYASTVNGKVVMSHFIVDGEYMSSWSDESTQGFKMKIDASASGNETANQQKVDVDQKLDYDCENWSPDSGMFVLPSSIQFTDYSQIMSGSAGASTTGSAAGGADLKTMQCAACDSAPDSSSKAQCRAALGCK